MKPSLLLAIPVLLGALYGGMSATWAADPVPAATAPPRIAYEKFTLPNGLEVILVENHRLPLVAVNIWYHVGPANEGPGLSGFAHLFEHMMFAASKHVPRGLADRLLEGAGATDSNGSTDFDRTNYFDTVPSNQLEPALWVHADRMGYLLDVLDQGALSNQQDVVRNERRQNVENRPYGIVQEALFHQLFPKNHPYYGVVMGSHADIQSARLADVRDFFTRYYGPNNATLVIAGDIDKARVRALVGKYFGSFKRSAPVPRPSVTTPAITSERRQVVADRVELPRVFMGWLTPPAYQPGDTELAVAAQILAGGKSSRLYKSLVYERQIAQEASAGQSSQALASMFIIDVTARAGHTAQEIEAAIDAELDALRTHGPSEKEVERARNTIETRILSGLETIGGNGLANQVNHYNQYTGDPGYLSKDLERLRRVTAADVQRVMRAQLQQRARAVVVGVPGTPDLGPEVPTPAPVKAQAGHGAGINRDEAWRQRPPRGGPTPRATLPQGEAFRLPNGLTVIHHYNPALPLVAAELVVRSGSDANPATQPGLAGFTAQLLTEGTATRSAPHIADEIAQLGAFLEGSSSADGSKVTLLALKSTFAQALEVLADVALHPAFPNAEVERQRASRLGQLTERRENPEAVAAVSLAAALYGARHPYGYGQLGTEPAIRSTTRDDIVAFWRRHYVPANAALVVSGDITRAALKTLAEARFGSWPAAEPEAAALPAPTRTSARLVLVDKPGAPQTALRLGSLAAERKTPDYPALEVMNAALGGLFSSRLNQNLREDKGYSYGVSSAFVYYRSTGPFLVAGSVRADVTGPSVGEMFKEVDTMRVRPLSRVELARARDSQILSLPGQFETNRRIAGSLADMYLFDLPADYYSRLPGQFAQVSAAQVQQVARKYLAPSQLVVVAVGDKARIGDQFKALKLGPAEVRDSDGQLPDAVAGPAR